MPAPAASRSSFRSGQGVPNSPEEAVKKQIEGLRAHGFNVVKKCAKDASVHLSRLMQSKFDSLFNFDEKQLPRRWGRRDDIPAIFKTAREASENLIDQYALIRLSPEEDKITFFIPDQKETIPASADGAEAGSSSSKSPKSPPKSPPKATNIRDDDPRVILTHSECAGLLDQARASTNQSFKAAIQDQEAAKNQGVSPMLLVIILVLGWNEFMMILSWVLGPLLLPLVFIIAASAYVVYSGALGAPTTRLIQGIVNTALGQVWAQLQGLLEMVMGKQQPQVNSPTPQRRVQERPKAD